MIVYNKCSPFTKEARLRNYIRQLSGIIIAYSGGVDSSYLAYITHQELQNKMLAVLAVSPSLSSNEKNRAVNFVKRYSIPYKIIETNELDDINYFKNDENRCYYCKNALFEGCKNIKEKLGWKHVAYGFNFDDVSDFRPGQIAADKFKILRPLHQMQMTKEDIRLQSEILGLDESYRPAQPCLASRLNYGTPVTSKNLFIVDSMESYLHTLGFTECRARFDGDTLRIEVPQEKIEQIIIKSIREKIIEKALSIGVSFIALDLEGFVSGKLNRVLKLNDGVQNEESK